MIRGTVLTQLAYALAAGGDCLTDIGMLRDATAIVRAVASDPTVSRVIDDLAAGGSEAIAAAHAKARARVHAASGGPRATWLVAVDIDANADHCAFGEGRRASKLQASTVSVIAPVLAFLDHGEGGMCFAFLRLSGLPHQCSATAPRWAGFYWLLPNLAGVGRHAAGVAVHDVRFWLPVPGKPRSSRLTRATLNERRRSNADDVGSAGSLVTHDRLHVIALGALAVSQDAPVEGIFLLSPDDAESVRLSSQSLGECRRGSWLTVAQAPNGLTDATCKVSPPRSGRARTGSCAHPSLKHGERLMTAALTCSRDAHSRTPQRGGRVRRPG